MDENFFFNILSITEWIQKSTSALIYLPHVGRVYTVKCLPIALKAVSQTQQALATKSLFFISRSTFTLLKKAQINALLNNIMSWQNLVQGWVCGCVGVVLYPYTASLGGLLTLYKALMTS